MTKSRVPQYVVHDLAKFEPRPFIRRPNPSRLTPNCEDDLLFIYNQRAKWSQIEDGAVWNRRVEPDECLNLTDVEPMSR